MAVTVELESSELELVLESLRYTKQAFERYEQYPSDEFKAGRVTEVQRLIDKLHGAQKYGAEPIGALDRSGPTRR